jgi:CBS domain-containing protein
MEKKDIGFLPVLEGGKLVGVVSGARTSPAA